MSNNKFTFENFFPDKNNNCNDDDCKNDNVFKETTHFFPKLRTSRRNIFCRPTRKIPEAKDAKLRLRKRF